MNDMLRDLSAQQAAPQSASEKEVYAHLQGSSLVNPKGYSRIIIFAISLLVFVAVYWVINLIAQKNISNKNQLLNSQPLSVEKTQSTNNSVMTHSLGDRAIAFEDKNLFVQEPMEPSHEKFAAPQTGIAAVSGSDEVNAITQKSSEAEELSTGAITHLLALADLAIAKDRLTTPFADNAYTYFQQVLALSPHNLAAHSGLERIANRYLEMAQVHIENKNYSAAQRLLHKAEKVVNNYAPIQQLQIELEQLQLSDSVAAQAVIAEQPDAKPFTVEGGEKEPVANQTQEVNTLEPQADTGAATGYLSVSPSEAWQDQAQVELAQKLVAQGNSDQAINNLENYLAKEKAKNIETELKKSTAYLLELYIDNGQVEKAERLSLVVKDLDPVTTHYIAAKIAVAHEDYALAIQQLEVQLNSATQHEKYRSLLAGLYQASARYKDAALSYHDLLNQFGDKPAYWLGYALALDALHQHQNALMAYQRLAQYADLQVEVRAYINQRIDALKS